MAAGNFNAPPAEPPIHQAARAIPSVIPLAVVFLLGCASGVSETARMPEVEKPPEEDRVTELADPDDVRTLGEVEFVSGKHAIPHVALASPLGAAVASAYGRFGSDPGAGYWCGQKTDRSALQDRDSLLVLHVSTPQFVVRMPTSRYCMLT